MDSTATDGVGEEHFTEEYVTGDVGPKEYDYSYRDYGERVPEAREVEGDMGPALSAVTYEAGVSHFASEAKKKKNPSHFNHLCLAGFVRCTRSCLDTNSR